MIAKKRIIFYMQKNLDVKQRNNRQNKSENAISYFNIIL